MLKATIFSLFTLILLNIFIKSYGRNHEVNVCDTMTRSQRIKLIREVICKNVDSDGASSGRTGLHTPKSIRLFIERCCNNIAGCDTDRIENLEFNICEAY